nr:helix-turn-helix domain-containing protein [Nocardioides flavescens]
MRTETCETGGVHDPTVLRAIAHPVRTRILGELAAQGSLRAADIARELDIPANQASFHLRQLAKYGLVEEDAAAARDKRDRVWRATSPDGLTVDLGSIERAPGGAAASRVFRGQAAAHAHELVDAAYSDDREPGTHRTVAEHTLRLDEDEARDLAAELTGVLDAWTERTRGRDPRRRTYTVLQLLQPTPR